VHVKDAADLSAALMALGSPGKEIALKSDRGGEKQSVTATLREWRVVRPVVHETRRATRSVHR
jgi:S1-C subfamily serine protease